MPQTRVRSVVDSGGDVVGVSVGRYVGCRLVGKSVSGMVGVGLFDG